MNKAMESMDGFRVSKFEFMMYGAIFLVIALWYYYKWNRKDVNRLAAKLKGPPSYPIIGSGLEFLGTPQLMENLLKCFQKYNSELIKIWLGTSFAVIIYKPEDLQIVLNNSKSLEKGNFYSFFKNTVGESLFSAPVDKWRLHRRIIAPVFNNKLMKHLFPVFHEKNEILIKKISIEVDKTQPFNLWDYIASTSLDTICQTMMGYKLDTQSNIESEFANSIKIVSELDFMRTYKPWLYPDIIFTIYRKCKGLQNIYKDLHKLPNQIIKQKKEKIAQRKIINRTDASDDSFNRNEKNNPKVFLDKLLQLNETGANLSDEDLRDEVVTMMIAGTETTAITLCFCLLLLAIHQDIQDKVYEEIYEVLGENDELITFEDTFKLNYLEQVIKETLRLYPPGPLFLRELQDDIKISSNNYVLPKGTTCIISPLGTHHISELYPNPWSFDPDNFNFENVMKRHKYSFIPFSSGPRNCLGAKYAMLSMKVLVSTFLRNYSVHTDIKLSDIKLEIDLLMRSVHGYPVTIRSRDRRNNRK
ncbi:cytochrome P450 4C1-like isoform X2 [Sipha flava]|uniref:Cytochrome P450 4C1-like isoform X2 n=1 Tax=Sipha flava TaxID=143950 RepID=A0A8B8G8J7_9HEMI|nr:cytochrome P450 4C1-like isoform X2 [Sipha flava]